MNRDVAADVPQLRLPRWVVLTPGRGGQPRLLIDAPTSSAEIYLFGAHLTSWRPHGSSEVIFTSRLSAFDGATPIRGGVPVCLPWFGAGPDGTRRPKHGWARTMQWKPRSVQAHPDGSVTVLLSLEHDGLSVLYEIRIGTSLLMTLSVRSTSSRPRDLEAALHSYLAVHDVTACQVAGLEGAEFTEDGRTTQVQSGALSIRGPVDRVFRSAATVRVTDPGNRRTIVIAGTSSPTTVVWNPWREGAASMPDMADADFASMLCVETAAARQDAPVIGPGQSWSMSAQIHLEDL